MRGLISTRTDTPPIVPFVNAIKLLPASHFD